MRIKTAWWSHRGAGDSHSELPSRPSREDEDSFLPPRAMWILLLDILVFTLVSFYLLRLVLL